MRTVSTRKLISSLQGGGEQNGETFLEVQLLGHREAKQPSRFPRQLTSNNKKEKG